MRVPFEMTYLPKIVSGEYRAVTRDWREAKYIGKDSIHYDAEPVFKVASSVLGDTYVNDAFGLAERDDTRWPECDIFVDVGEPHLKSYKERIVALLEDAEAYGRTRLLVGDLVEFLLEQDRLAWEIGIYDEDDINKND